jgi:hypothetical protein
MTPSQFRKLALSIPDVVESEHQGHPDFRISGKIIASLGATGDDWAMVKLTAEQQLAHCKSAPECFQPCKGAWGRQGCTSVQLSAAKSDVIKSALRLAVDNVSVARSANPKSAAKSSKPAVKRSKRKKPS